MGKANLVLDLCSIPAMKNEWYCGIPANTLSAILLALPPETKIIDFNPSQVLGKNQEHLEIVVDGPFIADEGKITPIFVKLAWLEGEEYKEIVQLRGLDTEFKDKG